MANVVKKKLAQGTDAMKEAAFKVVYPELIALAQHYSREVHVPFVDVERMAMEKLSTPEAKQQIMEVIDDAIDAAEQEEHKGD